MCKKHKIIFITNSIPIYRAPIYAALNNNPDLEILILVNDSTNTSTNRESFLNNLPIKCYKSIQLKSTKKFNHVNAVHKNNVSIPFSLMIKIHNYKPDLIISSEFGLPSLTALIYCRFMKLDFVLSSEEIINTAKSIGIARKILCKILIPRARAFLAWGKPATKHLKTYSIPSDKIYYCAQAVDNNHWAKIHNDKYQYEFKQSLKVKGKLFLSLGRFVKVKGFDLLIKAWASISTQLQEENTLMLIGSGEEKEALIELSKKYAIPNFIISEWKSYNELPKYYSVADVFVFPSLGDVWGLVVNESLASGTPVIASKYSGSSQELITSDVLGELIDPLNINEFSRCIEKWILKDTSNLSHYAKSTISNFNFIITIDAIEKLISELLDS